MAINYGGTRKVALPADLLADALAYTTGAWARLRLAGAEEASTKEEIGMMRAGPDKHGVKPIIADCFLCQQEKWSGPYVYEGRHIASWDVWICNACRSENWDGVVISSDHGRRLIDHLKSKGIAITTNAEGHLPIPGN